MLLQEKFLGINLAALLCLILTVNGQDTLQPYLYYVNRNQAIDFLHFYNTDYKIAFEKQQVPGPLPIYLMNKHNLISDTLAFKVLPEFILFDKVGNVYILGTDAFHHVKINEGSFHHVGSFNVSNYRQFGKDLWRVMTIEDRIIGLQGSGSRTSLVALTNPESHVLNLVPYRKGSKSFPEQLQLNINYSYSPGILSVFITPYQSLFQIKLKDLTVSEIPFPRSNTKSVWYYFFDHIKEQHYAVRADAAKFHLYALSNNKLYELMGLDNFPHAIVDGKIHYIKENDDGRNHYLVPISLIERINSSKNYFILQEVEIKSKN